MSWFDDHFQPAYTRADLRDLIRARGVTITGDKTHATWRGEKTASVHVYRNHWTDYGDSTDKKRDYIDWLEIAEGMSREEARAEAARILNIQAPRWRLYRLLGRWL